MAKVDVTVVAENDTAAAEIQKQLLEAESAVRERAHDLAMQGSPGSDPDLANWLQAEQQLFWVPSCELVEYNGEFRLRAAVPGLEARQLRLTALPGSIVIKAAAGTPKESGQLRFSEFNRHALLRRIDLPSPIDVASAKAKLEKGVLELVASKQAEARTGAPTLKRIKPRAKKTTVKQTGNARRAKAAKA